MSTSISPEPEDSTDPVVTETPAPEPAPASANPDPITGEPGAHPVGVGVGALGAGAAGAAIGSIGGPIGMLIGAAIGAVAGGLAGKEVATNDAPGAEEAPASPEDAASSVLGETPTPISMASVPGEGLRAMGGAGFSEDAGGQSSGTANLFGEGAAAEETGFRAPEVPEGTPLAGAVMPPGSQEALRVSAYYHYIERHHTGSSGDELGDWLAAEKKMPS